MKKDHVSIFGRKVNKSDVYRLLGLLGFVLLVAAMVVVLWPSLRLFFEGNSLSYVIENIKSRGAAGVFVLFGLQFLQIIIAFIPGEVVQVAAGMLYGPWLGALIVLVGCVLSSSVIYQIVYRLGVPFVRDMLSKEHLEKFYSFERSNKLNVVVFVLFLIPGMPKDVFTYLVPLTGMRMRTFLILTTAGRLPGVLVSTYAAAGLAEGEIVSSLIIFGIAAVLLVLGMVFRDRIFALLENKKEEHVQKKEQKKEDKRKQVEQEDRLGLQESQDQQDEELQSR